MPTILIVDDAIENVRLLKNLLQDVGKIVFAHNGRMALEQAALHRPDIVLLDVIMPELDGYETCRRLKVDPDTRETPVIFVTGADADSDEEKGLALGAIDYITKPFVPAIVRARVQNQLALVQANLALRAANSALRKFKAAVDCSSAAIAITDADGKIDYVNTAYAAARGVEPEAIGATPELLLAGVASDAGPALHRSLMAGASWRGEVQRVQADGSVLWEDVSCAPVYDEEGSVTHIVAIHADITQRKAMEEELRRQAITDALTGLANRRHLLEVGEKELQRRVRSHEPLALLMLDIDHFKHVNDTWGHPAGDEVIRSVAQACNAVVRITDTVGRLGGEEFAVLLPMTNVTAAVEIAERLRQRIAAGQVVWQGQQISFQVSIGVAAATDEQDTIAALIARADAALYLAKQAGRNRVVLASTTSQRFEEITNDALKQE